MPILDRLATLFGRSKPVAAVPPGAVLAATVTTVGDEAQLMNGSLTREQPASLGFVPVAVHFDLFGTLTAHGGPATAEEIANEANARLQARSPDEPGICRCSVTVRLNLC